MTDLLGVCTAWADGFCVVQPEVGDPVRIALADIVSGKPVPPRPPTRHRVAPREAQVRAMALFPDLETEELGEWVLRRSPTEGARRANSVLAFGEPGTLGAVDLVRDFYARPPGSRPIAAVLPGTAGEAAFLERGWVPESDDADTLFQLAGVAQVRRRLSGRASDAVRLEESTSGGAGLARAQLALDGEPVASGVAAYERDWVGFRSIEVAPTHRRRGLGLAVMATLLEWGAEQGATTAYLQVLGQNDAALGLYRSLGFGTHHAYRYLAAPAER